MNITVPSYSPGDVNAQAQKIIFFGMRHQEIYGRLKFLVAFCRILIIHINENDRGTPGKGSIDWDSVFGALKEVNYDGWITLEAFSTAIPDFANAINVWRNFSPYKEIYQSGFELVKQKWSQS